MSYASKSEGKTVEISCRSPDDRSARAIFRHAQCSELVIGLFKLDDE